MTTRLQQLIAMGALGLLALSPATAIEAADPPEHEERLLHDHEESPLVVLLGKHGHDLIALDVREAWSSFYNEPVLIVRMIMDDGCNALVLDPCDSLSETFTFKADGTEHKLTWSTDDDATWTGDYDDYEGPTPYGNATLFQLDGMIRFSRLGIQPGSELTDFHVQGYWGEDEADTMPEGEVAGFPDPTGTSHQAESYTVRFPDYYGGARFDASSVQLRADPSVSTQVALNVSNPLDMAQEYRLDATALPGVDARFVSGGSETISHTIMVAGNSSETVQIILRGQTAGAGGDLTIRSISDAGGFLQDSMRVDVDPPPQTTTQTTTQTTSSTSTVTQTVTASPTLGPSGEDDDDESEDSPGIGLLVAIGAVMALAGVAMRRRV